MHYPTPHGTAIKDDDGICWYRQLGVTLVDTMLVRNLPFLLMPIELSPEKWKYKEGKYLVLFRQQSNAFLEKLLADFNADVKDAKTESHGMYHNFYISYIIV